jgi:two-component system sensor histidine kinase/response regulator
VNGYVLEINCESRSDGEAVLECSVTDTGIGIPPEKCEKIFEKFEQADTSTTRNYGGTGLGLTISSKLAGLMGGRIWVESKIGQGSTFHFTARFDVTNELSLDRERLEPVVLGNTPILVVDDNATNRRILEEMVKNFGMEPAAVSSAHEAIQKLREAHKQGQPFPLVLSDVHMPEVDGFTLAEWIRQDESLAEAAIIMLTSGGRPGDRERRASLGIAANLIKPVKQSELFDTIASVLGISAAEDDGEESAIADQPVHVTPLHILLAEDSLVNQKLAIAVLEKQGHTISVANNGKEAVEAVTSHRFDLVLMDVQMPEMDGLEATRTIRQHERTTGEHIAIIAMTAHAMNGDRERCLESGMDGYIPKPVRARELFETLARIAPSLSKTQESGRELRSRDEVDWISALDRVGGNKKALLEVVQIFREMECPKLMREIRQGIAEDDAVLLQRAAHTLKGLAELFAADRAFEAARTLEGMAREENLRDADSIRKTLEEEIAHLMSELEAFESGQ